MGCGKSKIFASPVLFLLFLFFLLLFSVIILFLNEINDDDDDDENTGSRDPKMTSRHPVTDGRCTDSCVRGQTWTN